MGIVTATTDLFQLFFTEREAGATAIRKYAKIVNHFFKAYLINDFRLSQLGNLI
jgi:hypothetical protein